MKTSFKQNSGFSLIEMVIVLVIVGIITGGIYLAVGAVDNNRKLVDTKRQINEIRSGMRDLYAGKAEQLWAQDKMPNEDMEMMVEAGVFPSDIGCERESNLHSGDGYPIPFRCPNPFGGLYSTDFFGQFGILTVEADHLPQASCIELATSIASSSSDDFMGIATNFYLGDDLDDPKKTLYQKPPFTPSNLRTKNLCTDPTKNNILIFVYDMDR